LKLSEYMAKEILSRHGINIPKYLVIKEKITNTDAISGINYPVVIKAQIPVVRRAEIGGIKIANTPYEAKEIINNMLYSNIGGYTVNKVLVEEFINAQKELYLSFYIDRDSSSVKLLAGELKGRSIEDVPRERLSIVEINPLIGIQDYMIRKALRKLSISDEIYNKLIDIIRRLYSLFVNYDLTLLELSPIALSKDSSLIVLDVKMIIDDYSLYRQNISLDEDISFESMLNRLGISGGIIDHSGNIAVITSGAGCLLATIDTITAYGGKVLLGIDLGGTVFDPKVDMILEHVFKEINKLKPKVVFVNAFFQMARGDLLANAIRKSIDITNITNNTKLIARIRGKYEDRARDILNSIQNTYYVEDFEDACAKAVEMSLK